MLSGLRGRQVVCPDPEPLAERLVRELRAVASRGARERGAFHLALSGGSTPLPVYRRLGADPELPWSRIHLWLVDERRVSADDERSNWRMIRERIAQPRGLSDERLYPMPVLDPDGDRRYEGSLRAALGPGGRLDFVLLGMGADGHTASLFPGSPALAERERWVVFNDGPRVTPPRPRMTLTFPVLNAARALAVLVTSRAKHAALARVGRSPFDPDRLPITGLAPVDGDEALCWYLDEAAASGRGPA